MLTNTCSTATYDCPFNDGIFIWIAMVDNVRFIVVGLCFFFFHRRRSFHVCFSYFILFVFMHNYNADTWKSSHWTERLNWTELFRNVFHLKGKQSNAINIFFISIHFFFLRFFRFLVFILDTENCQRNYCQIARPNWRIFPFCIDEWSNVFWRSNVFCIF